MKVEQEHKNASENAPAYIPYLGAPLGHAGTDLIEDSARPIRYEIRIEKTSLGEGSVMLNPYAVTNAKSFIENGERMLFALATVLFASIGCVRF